MRTYIFSVITTSLSLLTLIMLITKNKVLSKHKKTGIIIAASLIIACSLAEFLGVLLDRSSISLRPVHLIVKYLEFCLAPIIPIALATAFYPIKFKKTVFIPNVIHIVLETISLFCGLVFYIDNQNIYHHGKAHVVYYFFIFLNMLYLSYTVVKFGAQFQNRNNVTLLMLISFVLMSLGFQLVDNSTKIVWLTSAIVMILFYIYYCNMVYQLDVLTELLTRRAFEVHKSSLKRKAYILFFDVNNFKSINDRLGHDLGDLYLKNAATAIRKAYGKYGLCYRFGGDEFCVIIDRKINSCNIEKLNAGFNEMLSKQNEKNDIALSVAIGYSVYEPGKTQISDAIKKADAQMYLNKENTKKL